MECKKSAIYIRVSTNHQIDKESLPLQRKDMINYSKLILNISDYEVFQDAGYSGKNTKRPGFQEMMQRIREGEFTHLLVWKIDRISRNLIDFCQMYEELKKYNCTFISKNEQFDTSTAMGETMLKLILAFAELERKLTGERVTAVMLDRANRGLWNGAPIPLGYKWDKVSKFPVLDPVESKTVELIYNKYLEVKSSVAISNYLNSHNIRTKRNGTWTSKTVSDIIRNPFYKGTFRYNYRETAHGKKKKESEWVMLEDNHQAIISKELWSRCNEIMDKNAERNTALFRAKSNVHIFASLIRCGNCGDVFISKADRPNADGYRPSMYICKSKNNSCGCSQRSVSDKIVGTFVFNFAFNIIRIAKSKRKISPSKIEPLLMQGKCFESVIGIKEIDNIINSLKYSNTNLFTVQADTKTSNPVEIENLKKQKEKYMRALDRLEDLYLFDDEGMSEKDYVVKKNKIKDKIDSIDSELNKTVSASNDVEDMNFFLQVSLLKLNEYIKDEIINYKKFVQEVGRELLKEFVNTIIEKIIIKDRKVQQIEFKNGLVTTFIYE